jgi:S1-C subfamily serine protease
VVVGNYQIAVGGDLIMAIDGRPMESRNSLSAAMNHKRPGDTMEMTVFRAGKTLKIKVKLGEGSTTL